MVVAIAINCIFRTRVGRNFKMQVSKDRQKVDDLKRPFRARIGRRHLGPMARRQVRSVQAVLPSSQMVGIHALVFRGKETYIQDSKARQRQRLAEGYVWYSLRLPIG